MSELLNSKKNSYEYIEKVCNDNNITISELCRRANISRQLLKEWRNGDPKSITALKSINVELEKIIEDAKNGHEFSPDPIKSQNNQRD